MWQFDLSSPWPMPPGTKAVGYHPSGRQDFEDQAAEPDPYGGAGHQGQVQIGEGGSTGVQDPQRWQGLLPPHQDCFVPGHRW